MPSKCFYYFSALFARMHEQLQKQMSLKYIGQVQQLNQIESDWSDSRATV